MVPRRAVGRGRLGAGLIAVAILALALAPPTGAQTGPLPTPLPPRPLPTAPGASTTTVPTTPPPTAPPTTPPPTTPPPTATPTTPPPTAAQTTPPPTTGTTTPPPTDGSTSTTVAGTSSSSSTSTSTSTTARPGPPPPSISESSARSYVDAASRSGTNSSTTALLDALRPLYDMGVTPEEVLAKGFGRFPLGGHAVYRDDFGEYRVGPPEHPHGGTDIFAPFNTPVRAPAAGVVTFANEGLGGKAAYVTEPDGTWYYLAHLNGFAPGLVPGSTVAVGQVIGFNGDSGNAQGGPPHVHFEVHPRGGAGINPKPLLDQWLADALAAVPDLIAPIRQASRPLAHISVARAFDRRLRDEPPPADSLSADDGQLAAAFVAPLTPVPLRRDGFLPLPSL